MNASRNKNTKPLPKNLTKSLGNQILDEDLETLQEMADQEFIAQRRMGSGGRANYAVQMDDVFG